MNHKLIRSMAPLMLGLAVAFATHAAPVDPADAIDVPDQSAAAVISRTGQKGTSAESAGGARAVDLLIELQSKTAGLDFNERARENGSVARPGATLAAGTAPTVSSAGGAQNTGGLFGSGAVPMAPPKENVSKDSDWRGSPRNASPSQQGEARSDNAGGGGRISLPRELIQWVRENRAMVVGGALLVLAVFWGTSVAVSQRRR
jgi:hypothetical protein